MWTILNSIMHNLSKKKHCRNKVWIFLLEKVQNHSHPNRVKNRCWTTKTLQITKLKRWIRIFVSYETGLITNQQCFRPHTLLQTQHKLTKRNKNTHQEQGVTFFKLSSFSIICFLLYTGQPSAYSWFFCTCLLQLLRSDGQVEGCFIPDDCHHHCLSVQPMLTSQKGNQPESRIGCKCKLPCGPCSGPTVRVKTYKPKIWKAIQKNKAVSTNGYISLIS